MRRISLLVLGLLASAVVHAAEAPPPAAYTFTAEQAAVIASVMAEKRAAAMAAYNQANEIIAAIEKQANAAKPPDAKK